jgi:tartrate dehydratase beta subunit/fumarate hydratase class I family protein
MGVEKLPVFVVNDMYGNDLYQAGQKQYARQ